MLSPCLQAGCGELVAGETYCRRHQRQRQTSAIAQGLMPCIAPGCGELVQGGACPRHAVRYGKPRRPARNPWRDSGWPAIAARYRAEHPACEWPGCDRLADVVHHRDGSGRRGARANNDDSNLESLCSAHHGRRHSELHHAGVVELGPSTQGAQGSTRPRQGSPRNPRKKARARDPHPVSRNLARPDDVG